MTRLLFVDDEPQNVQAVCSILRDALGAEVIVKVSVKEAIEVLHTQEFDLVVTDIFIPMGKNSREALGPRARQYEDTYRHLGGLALLDAIDQMSSPPKVLAHTVCTDYALLEVLGEQVIGRVPKPAPVDVLLREVKEALRPPSDWSL